MRLFVSNRWVGFSADEELRRDGIAVVKWSPLELPSRVDRLNFTLLHFLRFCSSSSWRLDFAATVSGNNEGGTDTTAAVMTALVFFLTLRLLLVLVVR